MSIRLTKITKLPLRANLNDRFAIMILPKNIGNLDIVNIKMNVSDHMVADNVYILYTSLNKFDPTNTNWHLHFSRHIALRAYLRWFGPSCTVNVINPIKSIDFLCKVLFRHENGIEYQD